jgi:hypothetical protein
MTKSAEHATAPPRRRLMIGSALGLLAIAIAIASAKSDSDVAPLLASDWAGDPLWDDGNAEVATYRATETIYGAPRDHVPTLITVKEDFNLAWQTKADWPHDGKQIEPMLKANLVEEIPTPNYPYRSLTSIFARRGDPLAGHKISYTLHEWCGNTAKELRQYAGPNGRRLVYQTYWEGMGSGEAPLNARQAAALPEEQLFLAVRAMELREGATATFDLLPSLRGSKLRPLEPRRATLTVGKRVERTALGESLKAWPIAISFVDGGPPMAFEVADNDARWLLRTDFGEGRSYALESLDRRQYWVRS